MGTGLFSTGFHRKGTGLRPKRPTETRPRFVETCGKQARPLFLILAMCGVSASLQTPGERVHIVLVGDSTVAEGGGWGPGFRDAFGPDVRVTNLALNGRSSKSFLDEGAWAPALAARPDYILIQFGHNDGPGKGPERETDPATTYRANLTRYV